MLARQNKSRLLFCNNMDYRDIDYYNWDVKISDGPITYFDPTLSYQATGYRPIDDIHGLDFDPSWFTEIKDIKESSKRYCPYPFNSKPYRDFWTEIGWRCREGYSVNGYTLTGDNYYFINFYKLLSLELDMAGGAREYQTPDFYVEQYKYFHYVDLCRFYGLDGCTLKARGIGWSEINASMIANMYTWKANTRCMISAFLEANVKQTIKKVFDQMDYNNANTEGGMRRLRQKKDTELFRRASHIVNIDGQNVERGHMSEVVGVVCDETRKMRGDRVSLLLMEESGCHIRGTKVMMADGSIKNVEDIQLGDKVMGDDGTPRTVIQLHNGKDMMYRIYQKNGHSQIVNSNHIIYGEKKNYTTGEFSDFTMKAKDYYEMIKKRYRNKDGYKLKRSNKVSFEHQDVPIDPYVFGFWLGNGDTDGARFSTGDKEAIDYIVEYGKSIGCKVKVEKCTNTDKCYHIYYRWDSTKEGETKKNAFLKNLRKLKVLGNKHIPDCYIYNDRETLLQLLAGLIDSDGDYQRKKHVIEISQHEKRKCIIDKIEFICRILGMRISRDTKVSKERTLKGKTIKGGEINYRIFIQYGHSEIPCKVERKKSSERDINKKGSYKHILSDSFDIEEYGYDEYFGFSLDGNQLFLLEDFTICHNSWPQFEDAFEKAKALVEIQGKRVGTVLSFGTGGDKGANLAGLAGVFNDPIPSRVLGYKNRCNKTGEEQITGFFVPAYTIVRDKMDKRGYTPPEKGKEYFDQRRNALANNPSKYLIFCSEFCYTPEEALALEGDGRFNTELLTQQKSNIVNLNLTPQQYTPVRGTLEYKLADGRVDGEILGVEFIANPKGKVVVIEPPITPEAGGSYRNLYVMGIDGIDFGGDDTSEHTKYASDFAFVIKKRMMGLQPPMYVCFYRDRPNDIMECFRTTLKAILWYNCKALIEKTKTSFLTFMRGKKLDTKYMMRRPRGTMGNTNSGHSNEFGAPASETVIQHGLTLVDNYVEEYCDYLYYIPVIDELITYSYKNKRKFDFVAAMQMAELADEELSSCAIIADESQFKNSNKVQYVYGYYTDERGYKRKGKIPLKHTKRIEWEEEVKDGGTIYKSNPLYSGAISVEEDSLL